MNFSRGRTRRAATLVATAAAGIALTLFANGAAYAQKAPAVADGTPAIDAAIANRHWSDALKALDVRIATDPHDVQAQFKRGTVLARLNRDDDAIQQFVALTQAYPELPEPYNNLAALYAKEGRYEDARAMLVTATQANPNYSLAYENLGDLYLRLAVASYQRAQSLGRTSGATEQRLEDLRKIVEPPPTHAAARVAAPAAPASAPVTTTTLPQTPMFLFGGPNGQLGMPPYVAPSN